MGFDLSVAVLRLTATEPRDPQSSFRAGLSTTVRPSQVHPADLVALGDKVFEVRRIALVSPGKYIIYYNATINRFGGCTSSSHVRRYLFQDLLEVIRP